jgi:hypothetical protein
MALALAALAGACATAPAETGDWERSMAERRPEMPSEKTLENWRASGGPETRTDEAVRAGCAEVASAALAASGAAFPEGTAWETAFSAEAERIEVASFTDEAGRTNRFAVYEQIGNQVPYYWIVEGPGADAVAATAGAVWEVEGDLELADVQMTELGVEVVPPYGRFRFRFLDDAPNRDWIRPCRYLFEDAEGNGFTVLWKKMQPKMRHCASGEEIRWKGETVLEVPAAEE